MCASMPSGVMTSSAGLSFSSGLSTAKIDIVMAKLAMTKQRVVFILIL